jgi:hypothetical protein
MCLHKGLSALALLLFAGAPARADFVRWSCNWTATPTIFLTDNPANSPGHIVEGLKLIGENWAEPVGSATFIAAVIDSFGSNPNLSRFTFVHDAPFLLAARLTDLASHESGELAFSGILSVNSALVEPFPKTLLLGGNQYKVTCGVSLFPGHPFDPVPPLVDIIGASVEVRESPEPRSLLLAGIGMMAFFVVAWFTENQKKQRRMTST